ncbi:MAG: LicD family protein [bacterium]|nr:LicD family protein [bacterium]
MSRDSNYILEKNHYILKEFSDGKKIMVRDLQLEILTVMDEIHRICEKNHIPYLLIAGSSLGAVNYKGFIPWDDDMDIAIPIEYWDLFVEVMKKDLDTNFYFDSYEIDKKYNTISGPWMKVRKRGTYIEEVNFLLKNRCKRGNGVFVDVIPYGGIAENKFVDELERTLVKINMLFIVLLDNLHINPIPFKSFVYWFSKKCCALHKNSSLISQPVSVPWEKFLHEPVFKRKDVFPLKKYDFENRKFYSYCNIEKILREWYGPNCLKKWDGKKWVETLPISKRHPKHVKDINLEGDYPSIRH